MALLMALVLGSGYSVAIPATTVFAESNVNTEKGTEIAKEQEREQTPTMSVEKDGQAGRQFCIQ